MHSPPTSCTRSSTHPTPKPATTPFANAFSAYATAYALTTGIIPLVPIQIGSLVSGNVVADQQNLGKALGLGMIVVVAIVMAFYAYMQRRASRWLG